MVDAADAERRRLERDLHDGTQQRLVSLAMRLGMARAEHPDAAQAHQAIAEAHEEAKAALPSSATWSAACTRPCSRTAAWTRRCPGWRRGCRSRSG